MQRRGKKKRPSARVARSQSDPRKAVAELVQNSLDANARRVTIERRRVRRAPALIIRDDGEGIVPELLVHRAAHDSLRAHGLPGSKETLESLVEILAHAERNLGASS